MNRKLLGCVFALSLAVPSIALACEGHKKEQTASRTVKSVTITEVASLQKEKKATVVDANFEQFRKDNGIIPGAVLLTSFNKYDAARELPATKDTKLVFYCANTQCKASHAAAQRALEAGYTDVNVLPDGLLGWKKAGQATTHFAPQS
ncbi:rhodanese-like domain-containing protein [Hyalangium gracile]|uniref:rhodanese-like domain-containing protein n=1 Tax=Hyalangium gracile TaxID=394092 RepID=UPI001CCC9150|nr:rhodanese-like domain-containing protein [Hyalangium gracile]